MNLLNIITICGTMLYPISMIPQIIKYLKEKDMKNVSITYQLIYITALSSSLIYILIKKLYPLLIANIFEIIFMIFLLLLKILEKKKIIFNKRIQAITLPKIFL